MKNVKCVVIVIEKISTRTVSIKHANLLTLHIPSSYVVYGPLANGGTSLLFEPTTTYPDPGRYWSTVAAHQLTHFYGAPTAIRLLIR